MVERSRLDPLFRWTGFLDTNETLICVKSWRPRWDGRYLTWPTLLVDKPAYRCISSPAWDRYRFKAIWRALRARLAPNIKGPHNE